MFAKGIGHRSHLRKVFLIVVVFVLAFFTIEIIALRGDGAVSTSQWREWILSSPDNIISPSVEQGDYGREPILPSASGRVLVTGGGGMIGKRVVRRLLRAKIPVTVLDKLFFEDEVSAIKHDFPRSDLRVIIGDIRDPTDMETAMEDVKGVIHLAAVSRVMWCLENQPDCTDINVRGAGLVLDALKGGWFIQASSREVYGNLDTLPVSEDSPHKPANVYGTSKAQAEDVITEHIARVTADRSKNINAIMLRLSNVYGSAKDHPERLIPAIMRNALSNRPIQMVGGDQDLDMVFVEDVVDAISLAVTRLHSKTYGRWVGGSKGDVEVFNVGTSASTSAMTLIRKTLWLTNSSSPLRIIPGDDRFPSRYLGSTAKASSVLGYKARVSIDEGLHRLATELLEGTVSYLQKKAVSAPFHCKGRRYSVDDLLALDGCTGIISARNDNGDATFANFIPKDPHGKWNSSIKFELTTSPRLFQFSLKSSDFDDQTVKAQFVIPRSDWRLKVPQDNGPDEFLARLDPHTGFINLRALDGKSLDKRQLPDAGILDSLAEEYNEQYAKQFDYQYRLAPVCCENKTAPWPLFPDDSLASIILDTRVGSSELFNASQMTTMCQRFEKAEQYATARLDRLKAAAQPIVLSEAELPTGRAADWRMRKYMDMCSNVCDHPTYCIDTGDCMCGHAASCAPRPRFPFSDFANMPVLSYPPDTDVGVGGDDALVTMVNRSSWVNILNPDARRYLGGSPAWPAVTAVRDPDMYEKIKEGNGTKFYTLKNSWMGCFSADTVMDRATKLISTPYKEGESLAFIPFYSINDFFKWPSVNEFIDNAAKQLTFAKEPLWDDMIMTFTHDFGRCNNGELNVLRQRRMQHNFPEKRKRTMSWAPMGDLNSPCYYPDQDVVIPSRTCLQDDLRASFGDISKVKPIRQRSVLTTFKGRTNGIHGGAIVRQKLTCERPMLPGRLEGGDQLERWWQKLRPNNNYIQTINETVFCPLPRGTTGWATRTIDVIYGGCIPVIIGDQTHHPFWDVLDWSKFAVFVDEWDLDNFEAILLSYTWEELERKQANLMLVRDAFLYPSEPEDGNMKEALNKRTPFWFAMHSAWLRKQTKYPV